MLKQVLFSVIALSLIVSCSSTREISKASHVLKTAKSYMGTPYVYGGMSRIGIDCSGLTYLSYNKYAKLPRTSSEQAKIGKNVSLHKVIPGDLLFFATTKKKSRISHVGIVYRGKGKNVKFIHASTSKGVTISSLRENYWRKSFIKARRVL